jgi:hypothetical protein
MGQWKFIFQETSRGSDIILLQHRPAIFLSSDEKGKEEDLAYFNDITKIFRREYHGGFDHGLREFCTSFSLFLWVGEFGGVGDDMD